MMAGSRECNMLLKFAAAVSIGGGLAFVVVKMPILLHIVKGKGK